MGRGREGQKQPPHVSGIHMTDVITVRWEIEREGSLPQCRGPLSKFHP